MPFFLWSCQFCCSVCHFPALSLHAQIPLHFQPRNLLIFPHFQMSKLQLSRLSNRSSVSPLPVSAPSLHTRPRRTAALVVYWFRPSGVFRRLPFYWHDRCAPESHRPHPFQSTSPRQNLRPVRRRNVRLLQSPPSAAFHWTHPGSFPDACNL